MGSSHISGTHHHNLWVWHWTAHIRCISIITESSMERADHAELTQGSNATSGTRTLPSPAVIKSSLEVSPLKVEKACPGSLCDLSSGVWAGWAHPDCIS